MFALMLELGDTRGEAFPFRVCQCRVDCHECHSFARGLQLRQADVDYPFMRTITLTSVICIAFVAQSASQSPGSAAPAPIGAYSVSPELPGMGRPADTAATAARRRALLRRLGRATVLIPAAHERNIEKDYVQDNDFRQDNTFFYFTELETQDAWLGMTAPCAPLGRGCTSTKWRRCSKRDSAAMAPTGWVTRRSSGAGRIRRRFTTTSIVVALRTATSSSSMRRRSGGNTRLTSPAPSP